MYIHCAAARGDIEAVTRLLDRGVPVDARDDEGETPLMRAAGDPRAGLETLGLLLSRDADVDAVSTELEYTPLRKAAKLGRLDRVRFLLDAGADARALSTEGYGPLEDAVRVRGPEGRAVMQALIDAGADPGARTSYGEFPLRWAALGCDIDAIRLLLRAGADPTPLKWNALHTAVAVGTVEEVRAALAAGADTHARDCWDRTPWLLSLAVGDVEKARLLLDSRDRLAERGHVGTPPASYPTAMDRSDCLAWLLEQGADLRAADQFGYTPLHAAAGACAPDCVRVLLAAGADLHACNHVGSKPIDAAGCPDVLRVLVEAGADIDYGDGTGYWILKWAAEQGDEEMARAALDLDANPNTTSTGETALHTAIAWDQLGIARMLLDAGANPNQPDVDGWTPLFFARTPEAARMLLDAGADLTARDDAGHEPLAAVRDPDVIAVLVEAGAHADGNDARSSSPLWSAAYAGSAEAVRALLRAGARADAMTSWGEPVLMTAAEAGCADCLRALLEAGADTERKGPSGRTALFLAAAPEAGSRQRMANQVGAIDLRAEAARFGFEMPEGIDLDPGGISERMAGPYLSGGDTEPIEVLVGAGANLEARDRRRLTPLLLACSCGHPARVEALLRLGANPRARDWRLRGAAALARRHPDPERGAAILRLLEG